MLEAQMSLRDAWYLPRFRDDGLGAGESVYVPEDRATDRQAFSRREIKLIESVAIDYAAADRRWHSQYSFGIEDQKRRFMVALAKHISAGGRDFARAHSFYATFEHSYPRAKADKPGVTTRTLRTWAHEADDLGLLSLGHGGDETGIEVAARNEACLFFTSFQKHRLMAAAGAIPPDKPARLIGHRGRPLSGPEL
jgi:hypothetical protein